LNIDRINIISLTAIFDAWYWKQMRIVSMRVMTVLSSIVYKKSLLLSSAGRQQYTAGEVVNLIAVDCNKVVINWANVVILTISPHETFSRMLLLHNKINPNGLWLKKATTSPPPAQPCGGRGRGVLPLRP
jgi:hypothetical protein